MAHVLRSPEKSRQFLNACCHETSEIVNSTLAVNYFGEPQPPQQTLDKRVIQVLMSTIPLLESVFDLSFAGDGFAKTTSSGSDQYSSFSKVFQAFLMVLLVIYESIPCTIPSTLDNLFNELPRELPAMRNKCKSSVDNAWNTPDNGRNTCVNELSENWRNPLQLL